MTRQDRRKSQKQGKAGQMNLLGNFMCGLLFSLGRWAGDAIVRIVDKF